MEEFPRDRKSRDGLGHSCRPCCARRTHACYRQRRRDAGANYERLLTDDEWRAIEARGVMECRKCGQVRALNEFRPTQLPRRRRVCRECQRRRCRELAELKHAERRAYHQRHRCKKFGITTDDYDQMLEEQEGLCAICGRPLGSRGQTIDHCHETGRVRGIVHAQCNLVIGNAREDIHVLRGAITYLKRHQLIHGESANAGSNKA
ncbi:MAG: recombination endonuclease VII [Planctomycetaceae bacterium]|nr:MAG: recombination endonuclease VII [Planctomycetaceae bacterium]